MTAPAPTCGNCQRFRPVARPMLDPTTGRSYVVGNCAITVAGRGSRFDDERCDQHAPRDAAAAAA